MIKSRSMRDYPGVFNTLIADRMLELGQTSLEQFADYSGIGHTTLYNLVLGRVSPSGAQVRPSIDTLVKLSHSLEIPLGDLVYMVAPDGLSASNDPADQAAPPVRSFHVDVAGWAGAGPAQNDEATHEPPIYVEERFARGKTLRAFRIRGDSMAAGKRPIHDGDTVLVNVADKGQNTDSIVALLKDGNYVCKMLKDDKFGKMLQSRNPEHTNGTPSVIPADEVADIVGKVVRVIADE